MKELVGQFRPLPLSMPAGEREVPSDYLSRLSFRNGRDGLRRICADFRIAFQAACDGEREAVEAIALLGNVAPETLHEDAFIRLPEGKWLYRNEELLFTDAPRNSLQVCPACIEEDMARWNFRREARPFRRGHWCLAGLPTCRRHCLTLVTVGGRLTDHRHDTSRLLAGVVDKLSDIHGAARLQDPTAFECYVLDRLDGRATGNWLGCLPLYAAMQACSIIGLVDLHGPKARFSALSAADLREIREAGFAIACKGATGFESLVARLQSAHRSPRREWGAASVLGSLYRWLTKAARDPSYEPLREAVRNACTTTFPLGPGDEIFGRSVEHRRVHSVSTASAEYGIPKARLHKLLILESFVEAASAGRLPDAVRFDAEAAAPFLVDARNAMTLDEAAAYIGIPANSKNAILNGGFIEPMIRAGTGGLKDHAFRRADLDAFLAILYARADPALREARGFMTIPKAGKVTGHGSLAIVRLLFETRLTRVRLASSSPPYMSILVDPMEVRWMLRPQATSKFLSRKDVSLALRLPPVSITALSRLGALGPEHAATGKQQGLLVEKDEVFRFISEYVPLVDLAKIIRSNISKARTTLSGMGISPVFPFDIVKLYMYRRSDAEAIGLDTSSCWKGCEKAISQGLDRRAVSTLIDAAFR